MFASTDFFKLQSKPDNSNNIYPHNNNHEELWHSCTLNNLIISLVFARSLSVTAWLFSWQNWVFNVLPWLMYFPVAMTAGFAADAAIKKGWIICKINSILFLKHTINCDKLFHLIFDSISFDCIFFAGFSVTFVRKFFQASLNEN